MTTTLQEKPSSASRNEYRGAEAAADFGDVRAEFEALVSGCGIYKLDWRAKLALTGRDRVRWLNGMVTNNVRDLAAGRGVYAFVLNPQGHILADLDAYNRGESFLLDTDYSQLDAVLSIFRKYIIMDKVEIENVSDRLSAIGLAGPKARGVLLTTGLELPQLEPLQFAGLVWQQIAVTIVRGDNPGVESFELWLAPADVPAMWEALVKAGARPAGSSAVELFRIASGIPRYGQDIRERDLPQETEQQRALHFTKGCYIGQEIVERIRSRGNVHRKFTGFAIEGPLPAVGTKIQSSGKDVGEITSAASLPVAGGGEFPVALGYIRREASGAQLEAGVAKAGTAELPFAQVFKHGRKNHA